MSDPMQTARADLAFLRAVAEDRGPFPRIVGEHMVVVGLLYGLNVIYAWAGKAGLAPWPQMGDAFWGWLPATLLYVPYSFAFTRRIQGATPGPALKMFAVAWVAVGLMTAAIVGAMYAAQARTGVDFDLIWPAIAVALYGGAWTVTGVARRNLIDFLTALGCFVTAVICGALVQTPAMFLALGLGIVLFIAGPGLAIILQAKR